VDNQCGYFLTIVTLDEPFPDLAQMSDYWYRLTVYPVMRSDRHVPCCTICMTRRDEGDHCREVIDAAAFNREGG
jgi:hypothetical protein